METIKAIMAVILAFSSGIIISGAVFSFIAIIGVVPRLAQKTRTEDKIRFYEEAIIWGGIIGTASMIYDFYIPIGKFFAMLYAGCIGIFFGCLAVSLAEILNVIPILTRRGRIQTGLKYFILAVALGKLMGAIIYSRVPGFYYM